MVDRTDLPLIVPGVRVEPSRSLFILLHPDLPRWSVVNATGLAVARLCDGRRTVDEIAAAVAGKYGLPVGTVLPDVAACVADLARAGFLAGTTSVAQPASREEQQGAGNGHAGNGPPWQLYLYVTGQCNLRCRHCAVMAGDCAGPENGPGLSTAALHDLIDQALAAGARAVSFLGGEPLLRRDLVELVAHAAGRVTTQVATNATLMDDETAAGLAGLGTKVQVSMDGPDAEVHDGVRGRGAFRRAWAGIERLQRAGAGDKLSLNVALMRPNIDRATEMLGLAAERGVPAVRFIPLQAAGQAAGDWDELAPAPEQYAAAYRALRSPQGADRVGADGVAGDSVAGGNVTSGATVPGLVLDPPDKGLWCPLGRSLLVDAAGDIYPCSLFAGPEFRLGNVADTPLADALASEKLAELIAAIERRVDEIADCRACAWRHFCQGGCSASVWLEHGTLNATDGLCDLRRELFRELVVRQALDVAAVRVASAPADACAV
jgi:radical SAM protein with 4Fe4S-binding SPASM domain